MTSWDTRSVTHVTASSPDTCHTCPMRDGASCDPELSRPLAARGHVSGPRCIDTLRTKFHLQSHKVSVEVIPAPTHRTVLPSSPGPRPWRSTCLPPAQSWGRSWWRCCGRRLSTCCAGALREIVLGCYYPMVICLIVSWRCPSHVECQVPGGEG